MSRKFWLDGGYDRELVEGCRLHPDHGWITLRLGDVLGEDYRWPDDKMTVCRVCGVPRCGESDFEDCDLPRHHREDHYTPSGESWPIGGFPGTGGEGMSEGAFEVNGEPVVPGDTRCVHWPRTCGEAQEQCSTTFRFCDFCLYGPPIDHPERSLGDGVTQEEMEVRIARTERVRGEKLRQAVEALVGLPSSPSRSALEGD